MVLSSQKGLSPPLSHSAYWPRLVDLSTIIAVVSEITAVVRSTRFFNRFLHPFCVHLFQPNSHIDFPLLIGLLSFRSVVLRLYIGTARRIPHRISVFAFTRVYHRVRFIGETADVPLLQLCVFPRFSGICDFRLLPNAGAAGSVNLCVQPDVFSFRQHADGLKAEGYEGGAIRPLVLQGTCQAFASMVGRIPHTCLNHFGGIGFQCRQQLVRLCAFRYGDQSDIFLPLRVFPDGPTFERRNVDVVSFNFRCMNLCSNRKSLFQLRLIRRLDPQGVRLDYDICPVNLPTFCHGRSPYLYC